MLPDVYGLEANARSRSRPIGVTIIASLWGFGGVVVTLGGSARLFGLITERMQVASRSVPQDSITLSLGIFWLMWLMIGLGSLAISIGLLQLHPWARIACICLSGLSASIQLLGTLLLSFRNGLEGTLPIGLSALATLAIIGYLLRAPIQAAFKQSRTISKG